MLYKEEVRMIMIIETVLVSVGLLLMNRYLKLAVKELFYVTAVVKYTMSEITIIITCGGTVINAALVLVSDDLTSYKMEWWRK